MDRREFAGSLGALIAMGAALPALAEETATGLDALRADLAAATDAAYWARVRREFALRPGLVHLNCGSIGATPRLVTDGMIAAMREGETNPLHHQWSGLADGVEAVRAAAAAFIGATPDELAVTRNTTEGMAAVADGLALAEGDEVITTNHEHGGGVACWLHLAQTRGVAVRYVEMPVPHDAAQLLERIAAAITERTRAISVCHVDTITGVQLPIAQIADLAHAKDILLICDGAQAPGMLEVDVKTLQVDAYAASCHKWMLGPKGSGLLYIRREAQARIRPSMLSHGFRAYTAASGTRDVAQILGLGLTLDMHAAIGPARIAARCRELNRQLRSAVADIPGLTVMTPATADQASGILTLAIDPALGRASDIVQRLAAQDILIKATQGTYAYVPKSRSRTYNAIRISTHILNSENDLQTLADKLAHEIGTP